MGTKRQMTLRSREEWSGSLRGAMGLSKCCEMIGAAVRLGGNGESVDCSMVILMATDMVERDGERQPGQNGHNLNEKIVFGSDGR